MVFLFIFLKVNRVLYKNIFLFHEFHNLIFILIYTSVWLFSAQIPFRLLSGNLIWISARVKIHCGFVRNKGIRRLLLSIL